ncbi:hypothetical protein [Desulfurobacterium atlanticum]|uniref:DUF5723 domain-containing protein n=1 Tax=Desulfurobacterium atlanticum TaxID=240169 RepID=A0A238Y2R5_9BACT|nr:hypothetical protein [Desulfurobacterium atlanticum]SNR64864.1 hypothetical protein SAMN06265340_10228 [Desulfurobacterium atlanticum]
MKKIMGALTLLIITTLPATAANFEYPYIYKDPSIMAMGGAYTAVGGSVNSLFYNPAGLSDVREEAGFEVTLLKLGITTSEKTFDFVNDFTDVLDIDNETEQTKALNDLILKYLGENFHLDAQTLFLGIAKSTENSGFGFTVVGSAQFNFSTHTGAGTDGLIEVHQRAYGGVIGGYSRNFLDGKLKAGIGIKYFYAESVDHNFTTTEILENSDNFTDYVNDNYLFTGSGVGFDVGFEYAPFEGNFLNPQFGLSILNVGDLELGDAGTIPMSVNLGVALKPEFEGFKGFFKYPVIALDIVDVTKNNGVDDDWGKRIRAGAKVNIWDNKFTTFAVATGLYQGYPTFGVDFRLGVFALQFATYAEEVGAYAGQDEDRRYTGSVSIEW